MSTGIRLAAFFSHSLRIAPSKDYIEMYLATAACMMEGLVTSVDGQR
jgi:hypothetical protein